MPEARILLVDDEQDLIWALQYSLEDEGYEVRTAQDGEAALAVARRYRPDLVILDIMMPHLDGLEVCRRLRRDPRLGAVPILFLTARDAVEERVAGLDEGADDYLTKPFDLQELKARIRALLRRSRRTAERVREMESQRYLGIGDLVMDLNTHQVWRGPQALHLTRTEFHLLRHLMSHPNEIFSSQQLLDQVWGYPPESSDTSLVRWHIKNLRSKIEPDPTRPVYICTVPCQGYVLLDDESGRGDAG